MERESENSDRINPHIAAAKEKFSSLYIGGQNHQPISKICITKGRTVRSLCIVDKMIWISTSEGIIEIFDTESIKFLPTKVRPYSSATHEEDQTYINVMRYHQGRIFCGDTDGYVRIYDIDGNQINSKKIHNAPICDIEIYPFGSLIWTGGQDWMINCIDVSSDIEISNQLSGHTLWVQSLCFALNTKQLWSCSSDGIRIWRVDGELIKHIDKKDILSLLFVKDNIWSGTQDGHILVWDSKDLTMIHQILAHHNASVSQLGNVGNNVWSGGHDYRVCFWDNNTYTYRGDIETDKISTVGICSDTRHVYVALRNSTICKYRIFTPEPFQQKQIKSPPEALSPKSSRSRSKPISWRDRNKSSIDATASFKKKIERKLQQSESQSPQSKVSNQDTNDLVDDYFNDVNYNSDDESKNILNENQITKDDMRPTTPPIEDDMRPTTPPIEDDMRPTTPPIEDDMRPTTPPIEDDTDQFKTIEKHEVESEVLEVEDDIIVKNETVDAEKDQNEPIFKKRRPIVSWKDRKKTPNDAISSLNELMEKKAQAKTIEIERREDNQNVNLESEVPEIFDIDDTIVKNETFDAKKDQNEFIRKKRRPIVNNWRDRKKSPNDIILFKELVEKKAQEKKALNRPEEQENNPKDANNVDELFDDDIIIKNEENPNDNFDNVNLNSLEDGEIDSQDEKAVVVLHTSAAFNNSLRSSIKQKKAKERRHISFGDEEDATFAPLNTNNSLNGDTINDNFALIKEGRRLLALKSPDNRDDISRISIRLANNLRITIDEAFEIISHSSFYQILDSLSSYQDLQLQIKKSQQSLQSSIDNLNMIASNIKFNTQRPFVDGFMLALFFLILLIALIIDFLYLYNRNSCSNSSPFIM